MDVPSPRQVIERWTKAVNLRDAKGAAEFYHEDAEKLQLAVGVPILGKRAISESMSGFFRAFPDCGTLVERICQDGEWVTVEWTRAGTWLDEFNGRKSTGKKFVLRGCMLFQVVAGKIKMERAYWDKATWFGQIGMPLA